MKKIVIGYLLMALAIFGFLSGGTFATFASIYLWLAVVLSSIASLAIFGILSMKDKFTWPKTHVWTNDSLIMFNPLVRICSFIVSVLTGFIAYKTGYENLGAIYIVVSCIGSTALSVYLKFMKKMYG